MVQRAIGNLIIPATFLITVAVLALNLDYLPTAPDTLWLLGPSIGITITGTLALSYNRSRIFLVCCLLAFCLWIQEQDSNPDLVEMIILGMVPLNILLICFYHERGAFTFFGVLRFLLVAAQFSAVIYLMGHPIELGDDLLNPFSNSLALAFAYSPFNQLPTILLLVSFLGCILMLGFDNTPITQGITTALVGLALGYGLPWDQSWEIYIIASALYLGASMIRDSYNMAYRDELTGLPHRRALSEQFLSMGNRYSVAMLDVDHFKKFNDTHGHDVGDQVLQMVAAKIRQVGGGGKAFRYGGEEFSVVFPRMTREDAFYYLDEVRKAIQNYEMVIRKGERVEEGGDKTEKKNRQRGSFRTADTKVSVTISIGVADRIQSGQQPDDVLKTADEALYAAKKAGRNQVSIAK
jgi:GGDEF domain-containing protein